MRKPIEWVTAAAACALLIAACASSELDSGRSTGAGATIANAVSTTAADAVDAPTTSLTPTTSNESSAPPETATTDPAEPPVPLDRLRLDLEVVAELNRPVGLAPRPDSDALFAVEQRGRLVSVGTDGSITTILDISDEVSGGNEQGLLGLAFSTEGELYVNFTDRSGATVVDRLLLDGEVVEGRERIMRVEQMRSNHNGGHLAFGPDGYLYIGLGDGGGGGDPGDHGQNPATLLGSMLRIDVSAGGEGYVIPPDHPLADGRLGAPEAFAIGLRNPWRYSFDPANGDLWIADVGQDRYEEVTLLRASSGGGNGANLGWNEMEGAEPYRAGSPPEGHVAPIAAYAQQAGRCSVTGGEVYRGSRLPDLQGVYLFGDFCTGEIFGITGEAGGDIVVLDIPVVAELTSFGIDGAGELLALSRRGEVLRIVER